MLGEYHIMKLEMVFVKTPSIYLEGMEVKKGECFKL